MTRTNFDFVGRLRTWMIVSAVVVAGSLLTLVGRGLDLSIDFVGGSSFLATGIGADITADDLRLAVEEVGATDVRVQLVEEGGRVTGAIVQTEALAAGSPEETAVRETVERVAQAGEVDVTFVGPRWGERISRKALEALVVFMIVVAAYISIRLEYKMAAVAVVALVHDIALTAGVYSLVGFAVSPATVIAFLTILGYSLYDTVVVFDRVKERTEVLGTPGRRTYAEAVNTSMNEVLWRSINTSMTSLLPVGSLLFLGSQVLGATTLQDLALALFVGMAAGTYSSLFIAGPLLAAWKQRDPQLAALARKAERKESSARVEAPATSAGRDDAPRRPRPTAPARAAEEKAPDAEPIEPPVRPRREREVEHQRPADLPGYVRGPGRKPRRKRR